MVNARVVLGIGLALGLATGASAQEEVTKSAVYSALDGAYGSIEVRQYHHHKFNADDKGALANQTPETQVRPAIGSKWFNDKLDISVTFKYKKDQDSDQVKESSHELWGQFDVVKEKYGFFSPAVWAFLPYKGKNGGTTAYVGSYQGLTLPLATDAGDVTLSTNSYLWGIFHSRPQDATIENRSGLANNDQALSDFGLTTNEEGETEEVGGKRDMSYSTTFNVKAKYAPIKAFSAELSTWFDQTYNPKYAIVDEDLTTETTYERSRYTFERLRLVYDMTDNLHLINDSYYYHAGAWAGSYNSDNKTGNSVGSRFTNIARVSYDLF